MNKNYFDPSDTLYAITDKYPETIELFVSLGFPAMKEVSMREQLGKSISLEAALSLKKVDLDSFCEKLVEKIEQTQANAIHKNASKEKIELAGVLPCPVKFPLLEAFEEWKSSQAFSFDLTYEFKAASMGVDWLKEVLKTGDEEQLPDLFISAGFDLFFDQELFGQYKAKGVFEDYSSFTTYHPDFQNEKIQLKDPRGQYAMLGVVPTAFLVNTEVLGNRKAPTTFKELLSPEFEKSVSLPIGDLDLFNAILLHIYKEYGEKGIMQLGRALQVSMHPSEMVKSHAKPEKPAVTIMPYFFTKMIKENDPMQAIWPEDGAIISPIFMLSKKSKKEKLQPIVDFFTSKEVGEILAHNGKFPSVNPLVDNLVPKENTYQWIGWDYIEKHDMSKLITKCKKIFNDAAKGV